MLARRGSGLTVRKAAARVRTRVGVIAGVSLIFFSAVTGKAEQAGSSARAEVKPPNIVYFVMEDASREDFGAYGAHIPTPNIDSLARQGIRFDNAWVASNNCSASRGAFYTGMYAHRNGLIGLANQGFSLAPDQWTLVDSLNDAGYETVLCGKQHERILLAGDKPSREPKGSLHRYARSICEKDTTPYRGKTHGMNHLVKRLETFFEERESDAPPFFLYVAPFESHGAWANRETTPSQPTLDQIELPPYLPRVSWLKESYREYLGAVLHLDTKLGELLGVLEKRGLDDNTLFVFTSDHGADFRRAKGTLYEAGVGVPLIIRWKGVVESGRSAEALVNNIDLMPTLLEVAGAKPREGIDGRSFLPLLQGREYVESEQLFSEHNFHAAYRPMRAVREKRFKLIVNYARAPDRLSPAELEETKNWNEFKHGRASNGRSLPLFELYDLQLDPHERKNLVRAPEHRGTLLRLRDVLYTWMRDTNDPLKGAHNKIYRPKQALKLMSQ
jgi:N-sulfoglucosamine sulfohydrolase